MFEKCHCESGLGSICENCIAEEKREIAEAKLSKKTKKRQKIFAKPFPGSIRGWGSICNKYSWE